MPKYRRKYCTNYKVSSGTDKYVNLDVKMTFLRIYQQRQGDVRKGLIGGFELYFSLCIKQHDTKNEANLEHWTNLDDRAASRKYLAGYK